MMSASNPDPLAVADARAREEALDTARSFIVQAPAGSGKTELLIQRYLALLAEVDEPEAILAITFTRKAAAEMRGRVLLALSRAADAEEPPETHARRTWMLARKVVTQDERRGWQLQRAPARLRIQTIDSLSASLVRQMPLLSRFGATPQPAENGAALALYREAAQATLAALEGDDAHADEIEALLKHLGNERGRAEDMLSAMLAKRDQWLRHFAAGDARLDRVLLEQALRRAVEEGLAKACAVMLTECWPELLRLARYAADDLGRQGRPDLAALRVPDALKSLPSSDAETLPVWRDLSSLLLTQKGTWRRQFTINEGFPPESATDSPVAAMVYREAKRNMESLIGTLSGNEACRAAFAAIRTLPEPRYEDAQWQALQALLAALRLAVANLHLVFAQRGEEDFAEIALRALSALGEDEVPTDLALSLDYRIRHVLIDEFQDTSKTQFELVKRLTAGWQPGDGRTLFAVGDPMQSIYRFREADVALFLKARAEGIGGLPLERVVLTANFRSQAAIVHWINDTFTRVFPAAEDTATAAVAYAPSVPVRAGGPASTIHIHALNRAGGAASEAESVIKIVRETQAEQPDARIAILVRARSHLADIVVALKRDGLRFRAVEVEKLGMRPVARDLLALTRALCHPGDRIAWLSLLRAPWWGLGLADLARIASDKNRGLWECACDAEICAQLSPDGFARLAAFRDRIAVHLSRRGRLPLRRWVEGAWLALGGPAAASNPSALEEAEMFLRLLEERDQGGFLTDVMQLEQDLNALYAPPDVEADARLDVMTIHKAKGLEFDVVILPGLDRGTRSGEKAMVMWQEVEAEAGGLLLAPIESRLPARDDETSEEGNPNGIYGYIRSQERLRESHEALRLAYVAASRARDRLHLLAQLAVDPGSGEIKPPAFGSLLAKLWPAVCDSFSAALRPAAIKPAPIKTLPRLRRFALGWQPPLPDQPVLHVLDDEPQDDTADIPLRFDWASATARHIGTIAHRWLQFIAIHGAEHWTDARIRSQRAAIGAALAALGVNAEDLDRATQRVLGALGRTLSDPRGQWLLSGKHAQARSEYPLTGRLDGKLVHIVIDRTFVDENGERWIIDFKTGFHGGSAPEAFLDREVERYAPQLAIYSRLSRLREERPTRLGLYFPMMQGWRELADDFKA